MFLCSLWTKLLDEDDEEGEEEEEEEEEDMDGPRLR